MSKSAGTTRSGGDDRPTVPRAVVHKKILDAAKSEPDASMEELARVVSGASLRLVEQVLEEYGDPAAPDGQGTETAASGTAGRANEDGADDSRDGDVGGGSPAPDDDGGTSNPSTVAEGSADRSTAGDGPGDAGDSERGAGVDERTPTTRETDGGVDAAGSIATATGPGGTDGSSTESSDGSPDEPSAESPDGWSADATGSSGEADESPSIPDASQLTPKQLQTLRAIHEDVNATQGQLADRLGVTRAAICQRVNGVDGFDWERRERFVEALFEEGRPLQGGRRSTSAGAPSELVDRVDELAAQLDRIERRLAERPAEPAFGIDDSALAHKVVHACVHSERISEEEELEIVRRIFPRADAPE